MEINTVHGFAEEEAAPGATVVISLGITLFDEVCPQGESPSTVVRATVHLQRRLLQECI